MELVELAGVTLGVERQGSGPPVLLLGGTGMPPAAWQMAGVCAALVDAGREVISYAARGVAPSSAPTPGYGVADLAGDTVDLIRTLGLAVPVDLVGYSLGSFTVEHLLVTRPDLVRRGVLIAGPGSTSTTLAAVVDCEAQLIAELGHLPAAAMKLQTLLTGLPPRALADAEPLAAEWAAMLDFQEGVWASPEGEVGQALASHAWLRDESRTARLTTASTPTLVVAFEFDPLLGPGTARPAVASMPTAELLVVPGAGHAGVMTHSEQVANAIVEFLERRVPILGRPRI